MKVSNRGMILTYLCNLDPPEPHFYIVDLGPVVQSIVSLTKSLRCQLVKYMPTILSNTLLFFVGKM